jgi:hypothetical protein
MPRQTVVTCHGISLYGELSSHSLDKLPSMPQFHHPLDYRIWIIGHALPTHIFYWIVVLSSLSPTRIRSTSMLPGSIVWYQSLEFTLSRKLMEFPMTSTFRVSPDLASIKLKFWGQQITSIGSNRNFQQPLTNFRDHNSWINSLIVTLE